ncbi:histidine phosphatase family protein [Candidatus Woesearchaeota archaeon]|nr:histidine phosphatase family protein [Candidatus Woesearchaeota archaeon]
MTELKRPKSLVIVRHGQSTHNVILDLLQPDLEEIAKHKKIRESDIELTKEGFRQARETGIYLSKRERFDICIASPYVRTWNTANTIVDNIGYKLKLFPDYRIREKGFGNMHGLTTEEIREKYLDEYERREREGKFYYKPLGGENYLDVSDRVREFMGKLVRDHSGENVLVVTHQVTCKAFVMSYMHLLEKEVLALKDVPNCGIVEFEVDTSRKEEGRMKLVRYGYVAYER